MRSEELKAQIETLGDNLTISNILLNAGKSLYNSYMTTANIVKVSALLVSKILTSKKGKKKNKKEED